MTTGEKMPKKNYKQDNKTIKEKTRRELSIKLAELAGNYLTDREQEILGEVLVDEKTFKEIGDKLQLTSARVRQIFERGVRMIHYFAGTIDEKMQKCDELTKANARMEQEIAELKRIVGETNKEDSVWAALPPKTQELLKTYIDSTDLSARVKNSCAAGNIYGDRPVTVMDLVKLSPSKMKTFRNCGAMCIKEIEDFFSDNGLRWGMLDSLRDRL